jgi:hypothetical protein
LVSFEANNGVFFLQNPCEKQGFFGGDDVRGAFHAAGAELGVAEEFVA